MLQNNNVPPENIELSEVYADEKGIGYAVEALQPLFVADELLATEYAQKHFGIESPFKYKIRRLTMFNERWYVTMDDALNEMRFLMSVTTFCAKSMGGISPYLLNYLMEMGKEAADLHKKWAAEYGTFFHIEVARLFKLGYYDFGADGFLAKERLLEYMNSHIGTSDTKKLIAFWTKKFFKDMAAMLKFCKDRNVRPIGVEFPILSYKWDLASVIDLICEMDFDGKRIHAIVDFKTSTDFHEEHQLQLNCYKELWNEHFGEILPIEHIFNWKPNDFHVNSPSQKQTKPSYTLTNQTNNDFDIEGRLMIGVNEGWFLRTPTPHYYFDGIVRLGEDVSEKAIILDFSEKFKKEVEAEPDFITKKPE